LDAGRGVAPGLKLDQPDTGIESAYAERGRQFPQQVTMTTVQR
jgi:hypothetical protein